MSERYCEIINHIPSPTPKNMTREIWHDAYINQLFQMYQIVQEIMDEHFPKNKIRWAKPVLFNNFSKVIYHCSSKHISEYI